MGDFERIAVSIVSGVIGLAIIAVIVSSNAQTSSVVSAASSGLSSVIGAAVAPVTGSSGVAFGSAASTVTSGLGAFGL